MQHLLGSLNTPEFPSHHHRQQRPSKRVHSYGTQTPAAASSFWNALTWHSSALSALLTLPFSLSTSDSQGCFFSDHPVIVPASALLHSGQTDFFILGQSQGRTWSVWVCLESANGCSVPAWPPAPAPQINRWMRFWPRRSRHSEPREKMSSAAVRSCTSCVWGREKDGRKDNGMKLRRSLTSDEQISCTCWWELCLMFSYFHWNCTSSPLSVRWQFSSLVFMSSSHGGRPWVFGFFFFPFPFRPKHIFQHGLHGIQ